MPVTVIFAGAGASKAVNPSEYPTTVEFFEHLPEAISANKMFASAEEYLRKNMTEGKAPDIEQVLWALQELDLFLDAVINPRRIAGWFLRSDRLLRSFNESTNYNNLLDPAPKVRQIVSTLIDDINTRIYDFYRRMPETYELEANWLPLLRALLSTDETVEVFTTNYDLNIEATLELLEDANLNRTIQTGRRSGLRPTLNESLWFRKADKKIPEPSGLLTKLHGSVDWSRESDEIYVGNPLYKGSHKKHVILYPGFKGVPAAEPFALFHNYLAGAVAAASRIIFIGFAFRDEYINDVLRRFTATHAKIFVIDPAPAIPTLPFPSERVLHVKKPFDHESVAMVLGVGG